MAAKFLKLNISSHPGLRHFWSHGNVCLFAASSKTLQKRHFGALQQKPLSNGSSVLSSYISHNKIYGSQFSSETFKAKVKELFNTKFNLDYLQSQQRNIGDAVKNMDETEWRHIMKYVGSVSMVILVTVYLIRRDSRQNLTNATDADKERIKQLIQQEESQINASNQFSETAGKNPCTAPCRDEHQEKTNEASERKMENSGRITPLCKLMHKQTDDTRNSSKIQSCTSPPRKSITHSDSNVNCATIPDRDVENQIDKVCAENDLNAQCFKSSPCRKVESCEEKIQQENFNDVCFKSTPCGDVEKCADEKSQEKTEDVCFKSPPCRDVEKSDDQTSQDKAKGLCFKSPASRVLEKSIDETSLDKTKGLYFKSPPCRDVEKGGANVLQENTRVLSFKSPPCKNVEKGECKTSQENNKSLRFKSPPCKDIDKGGAKALSFKSPSCKNVEKGAETALQNDSELQCSKSLPCEDNEKSGDEATSETSNSKSDIPPICKNELKQSTVSTPEQMSEIKSKKETSQTTSPWRVSNKPKKLIRMTSPEKPARDNYNVALVENSQVITNLQGIKDAVPGTEKNNITASNLSQNNHDCNNNSNDKNVCGQQNSGATKENASEIKPEDIEIDLSTTDAKESKSFSPCTKSPPCYLKKKEEDAKPEKKVCLKSLPGARCDGEDNTDYARREVIEFSDKACDDKRKENAAL